MPSARSLRHGSSRRRQRWLAAAGGVFVLYCLFLVQVRVWSGVSRPDLRPNVIPAGDDREAAVQQFRQERAVQEGEYGAHKPEADRNRAGFAVERAAEGQQRLRGDEEQMLPSPLSEEFGTDAEVQDPTKATASTRMDANTNDTEAKAGDAPIATAAAVATKAVASTTAPIVATEAAALAGSFDERHTTLAGYDETMAFLANYTAPEGSDEQLFLFFVCSDENGQRSDWRPVCTDAAKLVYDVFSKSPTRNRLVTVHAGTKKDWTSGNPFHGDGDLRLKTIPSILKWEGGSPGAKRATSGFIIEENLLYEPLLRYLFQNEDVPDPLLVSEDVASKEIVLLKGYDEYRAYMDDVAASSSNLPEGPLFLILVSGRVAANNRLWCPYCRYSELSVEYAFFAFAPRGSRLVKVETTPSYKQWKDPTNPFKSDTALGVRGVPWFYRVQRDSETQSVAFEHVVERFDIPKNLKGVFQGWRSTPT